MKQAAPFSDGAAKLFVWGHTFGMDRCPWMKVTKELLRLY